MKKIVLAYSGGLDTSVIVKWLKETYGAEIVEEETTFSFDSTMIEKYGEVLSRLIEECGDIAEKDKEKNHNEEGEDVEMEEGEGINPAIYDQLKDCIEKGHSYEEAKQHVADAVDGWDLSMEDYSEAKKQFGKDHRDGVELEEGEGEGSRYMFFSNLEQIKNQAESTTYLSTDSTNGVKMPALPTSDPGVAGALWRDGTTVKVSI